MGLKSSARCSYDNSLPSRCHLYTTNYKLYGARSLVTDYYVRHGIDIRGREFTSVHVGVQDCDGYVISNNIYELVDGLLIDSGRDNWILSMPRV